MRLSDALARVEHVKRLDKVVTLLRGVSHQVLASRDLRDVLHGTRWVGHPLHPVLVQVPLGAWVSAAILDAVPGADARRGARTLVGAGALAALPAILAGLADFDAAMDERADRVGVVHASANSAALTLFTASYLARRRGDHARGRFLTLLGLAAASTGGLLGGHLSYRMGIGVNHTVDDPPPTDWTEIGALDDLPDGDPVVREAAGVPLLVLRQGYQVRALVDRCSHLSGPLHEGQISLAGSGRGERVAADCVTCPWHGSVFRLDDGAVEHGPATAPQPVMRVRIVEGRVQVRATA